MNKNQIKKEIKRMTDYNIEKLNNLSNRSGISLMVINFWYNAIKN